MINLSDYIGQLMSEITIARTQADLETIRLAEMYANHDLLKHFPIPHIRLQNVNLEIPIVIKETVDASEIISNDVSKFFEATFLNTLELESKKKFIEIPPRDWDKIKKSINRERKKIANLRYNQIDSGVVADSFTFAIEKLGPFKEEFLNSLNRITKTKFLNFRPDLSRIKIGVKSGEIKEFDPDSLIRISLTVFEEGLEWTIIPKNGEEEPRLVPE